MLKGLELEKVAKVAFRRYVVLFVLVPLPTIFVRTAYYLVAFSAVHVGAQRSNHSEIKPLRFVNGNHCKRMNGNRRHNMVQRTTKMESKEAVSVD